MDVNDGASASVSHDDFLATSDLDGSNQSDEDSTPMTSAQVLELMEEAWINERLAPEVLPHKYEVVDCLLGQITHMEENLKTLDSTDFKKNIYQLELDRIRYVVSSYLRNRLEKIETYVAHILKQEEERVRNREEAYLTESEMKFAKGYNEEMQKYFANITSTFPHILVEQCKKQTVEPNLNSYVFVRAKRDIEGVVVSDGSANQDIINLRSGSQMILPYSSVAMLLKQGHVQLV